MENKQPSETNTILYTDTQGNTHTRWKQILRTHFLYAPPTKTQRNRVKEIKENQEKVKSIGTGHTCLKEVEQIR